MIENILAEPSLSVYTRFVPGAPMLKTATQEKHALIRRFAQGEIPSAQMGKKLVDIDRRNRTKKLVLFTSILGLVALILAPFLAGIGHSDPADSSASRV